MSKKVSVVIPTIEEESAFSLIDSLRKRLGRDVEIIVVDKSGDAYYRRLKETGARVFRQRDRGVENAIMYGLRQAKGDILASIDADETHDISGIVDGIEMIRSGKADLVLGNRLGSLESGSMSGYIVFGNAVLSRLFSVLYKTRVHDALTGLFVMDRNAFESIKDENPYRAGIAFFAIELARRGYRIKEVNIRYYKRKYGKSKLTRSKFAYGVNVASHLLRQIRDYSPMLVFGGIGVVVAVIGVIIGAQVLLNFIHSGVFAETGRALIAFMLVVLGFLLFIAGMILDVLVEIEKRLMKK